MSERNLKTTLDNAYKLELYYLSTKHLISNFKAESELLRKKVTRQELCGNDPDLPVKPEPTHVKREKPEIPQKQEITITSWVMKNIDERGTIVRTVCLFLLFTFLSLIAVLIINYFRLPLNDISYSFSQYLTNLGIGGWGWDLLIACGVGAGITLLICFISFTIAKGHYKKQMMDYRRRLVAYKKEKEAASLIDKQNMEIYQKQMEEYNAELRRRDEAAAHEEMLNKTVRHSVLMSKIKRLARSLENTRIVLDVIYQQNGLSRRYRDPVPLYVFRYYLKKGSCNTISGENGLISKYDKEQDMIPILAQLPEVKQMKEKVELITKDTMSHIKMVNDVTQNTESKTDSYLYEMNKTMESVFAMYNVGRRL